MSVIGQVLPQLYRFCFLMTGEPGRAEEIFEKTVQEAASRAARGASSSDRLWFFHDARWRCLASAEQDLQAEPGVLEEADISPTATRQIERLDVGQLAAWISAAPEPQRSALALFYLDEFSLPEILSLLDIKPDVFSQLISSGRRQFQAWLDSTTPLEEE